MARIYIGNYEAADKGLLDALRRLNDSYHVFVEFQIPNPRGQRQVDFLVIREDPVKPCIFMLEVKNERRRLRGTINGPWEYEDSPNVWRPLPVSNPRDQNPIQQAYNTARTMQTWLSSMRALIQDPDNPWPDIPTVFPRLVLPVAHPDSQLQTDSFTWRFDGYDRCLESLMTFVARDPVPLRTPEIERMAHYLGVQRQPDSGPADEPSIEEWLRANVGKLLSEIGALRQELRELRIQLGRPGPPPHGNGRPVPYPARSQPLGATSGPSMGPNVGQSSALDPRDLELAYRTLVEVVRDLKAAGRKLVFPNVQEGLWRRLGEFNVEQYGFFKFKEFLQEAARRNLVTLSLVDGVDYVSLPGEAPTVNGGASAAGPSSLEDLSIEERHRFLQTIAQLEARSAYMIRSYIARHLTAAAILPLPMYEIRSLVNDAVSRGLFQRGTRPFRHPTTGELQSLETLTLERSHPWIAEALASQPAPGAEDEADDVESEPSALADWPDAAPGWSGPVEVAATLDESAAEPVSANDLDSAPADGQPAEDAAPAPAPMTLESSVAAPGDAAESEAAVGPPTIPPVVAAPLPVYAEDPPDSEDELDARPSGTPRAAGHSGYRRNGDNGNGADPRPALATASDPAGPPDDEEEPF